MTTDELLRDYTKANDAAWAARSELSRIDQLLQDAVKGRSRALRAAVGKAVRGAGWACDKAHYFVAINHATRPVRRVVYGSIEVSRVIEGYPRAFVRYAFSPEAEAAALAELRRLVGSVKDKPRQPELLSNLSLPGRSGTHDVQQETGSVGTGGDSFCLRGASRNTQDQPPGGKPATQSP